MNLDDLNESMNTIYKVRG